MLDAGQKIAGWSETVKRLWDEDTRKRVNLRDVLLGSARLLILRGLTESLAGRFEVIRLPPGPWWKWRRPSAGHWTRTASAGSSAECCFFDRFDDLHTT